MQSISLSFILFAAFIQVMGQHSQIRPSVLGTGVLSGRVFAITKDGDLKPARIADVYILFETGVTKDGKAIDKGASASRVYMNEHNREAELNMADEEKNGANWSEKTTCMKRLNLFEPAMLKVLSWADTNKKADQIIKTQTDEEGNFKASLPAGNYTLLVRGRAGFNEALWGGGINDVTMQPGAHIELKLSSPSESCIDIPA